MILLEKSRFQLQTKLLIDRHYEKDGDNSGIFLQKQPKYLTRFVIQKPKIRSTLMIIAKRTTHPNGVVIEA